MAVLKHLFNIPNITPQIEMLPRKRMTLDQGE